MRCDDFHKRWQALLDQRRSPQRDELLCAHAATCQDCSEVLRIQTLMFREIERSKGSGRMLTQPDYCHPVRNRTSQTATMTESAVTAFVPRYSIKALRARRQVAKSLFVGLAVAASLLVLMIPAWRLSTLRGHGARSKSRIARSAPRALPPTIWIAKSSSQPSAIPAESTPSQAGGITAEQAALRRLMQNMAAKLSDVPEEQLEPLDRIAGGFRPLANTLGVAWDALRRTISVGRSPTVNDPQAILGWPGFQGSIS